MSAKLTLAMVLGFNNKEDNLELPNASLRRFIAFEDFAMIILQQYRPAGVIDGSIHIGS